MGLLPLTYDNNNTEITIDAKALPRTRHGLLRAGQPPSLKFPNGSLPVSVERRAGPTGEAGIRVPVEPGGPQTTIDNTESIKIYHQNLDYPTEWAQSGHLGEKRTWIANALLHMSSYLIMQPLLSAMTIMRVIMQFLHATNVLFPLKVGTTNVRAKSVPELETSLVPA